MGKKALLVGCNYPGTKAELKGCINDVKRMYKCLIERYGFEQEDITVLIDTDDSYTQPTGKNIRKALSNLIGSAKRGDMLFFHYSGHGTRLPAETGENDDTGFDECIVPCDMNLITDDDIREFVDQIPRGCRITIVSDSCHSGGLIEEAKEQIGESSKHKKESTGSTGSSSPKGFKDFLHQTVHDAFESRGIQLPRRRRHGDKDDDGEEEEEAELPEGEHSKNRSLPMSTLIEILKQKTGKDDIDVGKLRPTLFDVFGEDSSPKVKKFMNFLMTKLQHDNEDGELGTIAKSGTSAFMEKMQSGGDLNLIGQFGVGFYSVYLVADYVEVISKHNDDKQYIWESKADGSFAVSEDVWNEPLGRGTEIRLHLREEAGEYLEEAKLKELVKKYSEFINFPISLWTTKEVDVEVPADDDESSEEDTSESGTSEEEEVDEEDGEKKPKTKTVKETTSEWEVLNNVKAIWLRSPKEITDEEYTKFYHSLSKDFSEEKPMAWSHFTAEGDVEFKAVIFVPPKAPHDLYESYYNANSANLKLYVRRVFISDEFDDLLPKYLNFLKGLVDSDTLPLNVSREMLQQHHSLKTIKKKLIRKALDMIRRLAEEDPDESSDKDKSDVEKASDSDEKKGQYSKFWNEFGKSIKLGIIEDANNRNRLAKLLRFESTRSDGKLASLDQYISRMKPGQKDIFYITGTSKEQLEKSPFLERLTKKNYEVIFFTDPVDEYLMQYLMDYEDKKFQNVSKEGLKLGKDSKDKEVKDSFKELTKWWKDALVSENVDSVKISNRLDNSPCVVVTSKFGWSANMERIMQSQTLSDANKQAYMRGKRVLEINPRHPLIKELRERVVKNPEDDSVKETARLVYQTALMESGFMLSDPKDFASSIYNSVKASLNISPDATVEEEDDADEVEVETETKDAAPEAETETSDFKDEL